jgi:hypothetical protein
MSLGGITVGVTVGRVKGLVYKTFHYHIYLQISLAYLSI